MAAPHPFWKRHGRLASQFPFSARKRLDPKAAMSKGSRSSNANAPAGHRYLISDGKNIGSFRKPQHVERFENGNLPCPPWLLFPAKTGTPTEIERR